MLPGGGGGGGIMQRGACVLSEPARMTKSRARAAPGARGGLIASWDDGRVCWVPSDDAELLTVQILSGLPAC